jgi:hypothetical protein
MRSFLINKNLAIYFRLRKKIGNRVAFMVATNLEKVITLFGREKPPRED